MFDFTFDSHQVARVVQGSKGNVVSDGLDNRVINDGGFGKLLATVHDAVANGKELDVVGRA